MMRIWTTRVMCSLLMALVCVGVSTVLHAAELQVAEKGTYLYWFEYTDGDGNLAATPPVRFKGTSTAIDATGLDAVPQARLCVLDKSTGNLAVVDYKPAEHEEKDSAVKLDAKEFGYVRLVKLRIVAEDGPPLESALVIIEDADGNQQTSLVTPADEGVAVFRNVPAGETTVTVKGEGVKRTIDKDILIPAERESADFALDIKVAGDVHTLPAAQTEAQAESKEQAPQPQGDRLSGMLQMLAGLIFIAVVIAVAYVVVRAKGLTARSALEGIGVEIPEDRERQAPGAQGVPEDTCQFCGQKKDASGNCACTVTAAAQAESGGMQTGASGPRLVGIQGAYAGQIFDVTGESTTLGRDPGNTVALVEDNTASRRHATIIAAGGEYSIRDEGSSNGTFVNGAKVSEQKLKPGDEIQIGGTRFRFEL